MKSRLASRLTAQYLSLETLLLAGFLWLCVAPMISVVVLPRNGVVAAALTPSALQPTPAPVAERPQPIHSRPEESRPL